jgi:hypothetical protein
MEIVQSLTDGHKNNKLDELNTVERIEDIAKKIQRHRDMEITIGATNNAVGRSMTLYNKEEQQFWLITKEATVVLFQRDINGNPIPETAYSETTTLKGDGFLVPRDSKLGGLLIEQHEGRHKFQTPKGEIEIEIFNRATYKPSLVEGEFATDILLRLSGDARTYSFQNIAKILSLQNEIDEETEQLETATTEEAKLLVERIAEKEKEKQTYLDKAQSFIRKYAELRYQPILDPLQEAIKRSRIFDGALIINGGPGTGKTTSMIQRIKFLISTSIEEYKPLSQPQKDILFNQKTSWIFYSPNELLALFLRNSMKLEELTADTERVKVWASHKNELVKTYRFVSETKRPFLIYNKASGVNLFSNHSKNVLNIIEGLGNYYMSFQIDKLNKVSEIDVSPFKWKIVGQSIQNYIRGKINVKNTEELIRLYINLTSNFKKETEAIAEEYAALIKLVASRIQVTIQKDNEREIVLSVLLKQWKTETQDNEEDDDDDAEIEQEDFDEKEELTAFDFERELFTKLKSLCRKQALKKFDKNTRFSKRDKELIQLIPEISEQREYDALGQTAYFKKNFERITKGIVANILREIPMVYKKYRREQLNSKSKNWNLSILDDLVKKDKNSRIHSDEQALLLSFVNSIVLKIYKTSNEEFKSINHSYIKGFKDNCKPVIGIDEATDFSIIDLIAINSFGHPELSSITLSGDLMQRMTSEGITSWEDFTQAIPNSEVKGLQVSYRQSPTLLSLAKAIYQKSTGQAANYESYIAKDEAEPKPLMFVSQDEDDKLQWIANRILEIYRAYGNSIPSIAIFLPEENQLEGFATKLGGLDTLADIGILVKACRDGQVLGDKNTVRVFSIKVIKGLEFESVFFHNIDDLQTQHLDYDLFLKYLYVGLSRATFYLGLTLSNELSKDISFIEGSFDRTGKTWEL